MDFTRATNVRHKLTVAYVVLLSLVLSGCGSIFVGFVSNPQIPNSSTSGTVTTVVLISVNDINGIPVTVTAVTLINGGLSNTPNFCGDQRPRFPINATVRADFTTGPNCLSLVNVVILSG